jgi:hypothetical protein
MTTHTLLPFDADAHTVLTHTREAWEALGELLSGAPIAADRLGQATAAYERSLHQLGLHALRASYLPAPEPEPTREPAPAPPPASVAAPSMRTPEQPRPAPVAVAPPVAPPAAAPVTPPVAKPQARPASPAALKELAACFGHKAAWQEEAPDLAQQEAARLDTQVRALAGRTCATWEQAVALLRQIDALVAEPRTWWPLSSHARAELLGALVALTRGVEQVPIRMQHKTAREQAIKATLKRIGAAKREGVDPFIHGMGLAHKPLRGALWADDARHILGLTSTPAAHTPAAPKAAHAAHAAPAPDEVPAPRANPCPQLAGQRLVIVGGDRRSGRVDELKALLELGALEWLDTAPDKHRHLDGLIARLKGGSVDAVVIIKDFTNHSATNRLREAGKKLGVPLIWVSNGYGEAQLIAAVQRCSTVGALAHT